MLPTYLCVRENICIVRGCHSLRFKYQKHHGHRFTPRPLNGGILQRDSYAQTASGTLKPFENFETLSIKKH